MDSYLDFVAKIKGVDSRNAERIEEVKDRVSVKVQQDIIKNLSKGYRQRAGLAQALIHDPQY